MMAIFVSQMWVSPRAVWEREKLCCYFHFHSQTRDSMKGREKNTFLRTTGKICWKIFSHFLFSSRYRSHYSEELNGPASFFPHRRQSVLWWWCICEHHVHSQHGKSPPLAVQSVKLSIFALSLLLPRPSSQCCRKDTTTTRKKFHLLTACLEYVQGTILNNEAITDLLPFNFVWKETSRMMTRMFLAVPWQRLSMWMTLPGYPIILCRCASFGVDEPKADVARHQINIQAWERLSLLMRKLTLIKQ